MLKKLAIAAVAGALTVGQLSVAMAADKPKGPPPPVVVPVVQPVAHPLLHNHPFLWCAGGLIITALVQNAAPAIVGCSIGAVHHFYPQTQLY